MEKQKIKLVTDYHRANDEIQHLRKQVAELEADQEGLLDDTQKLANALLAQEKANNTLNISNQVLRKVLEMVNSKYERMDVADFNTIEQALSTTPNQEEWIRKDTLELEGYWKQGDDLDESDYFPIEDFPSVDPTGCTPLYRIKETTK